ncbi:transcription factor iws1 [Neolentinus lepideus HHB14362 ss-1]|uniref:Transcription factor iws1 n=1 Tax=Neolentinus lepideus HHB14362 ss-1 TaxID=1314782 RepID=A0A165Q880_9AGAM|nr:transcription factor iws1 [Neolentinus lepideus HHB14362 ss-1]
MSDIDDANKIERDIFGGSDSELSEEDEVPQPRRRPSPLPADEDESSEESEDDYVQEKRGLKPKKRSKARKENDDGERRPAQRKRKRRPIAEEDLSQLPPEQANKYKLDMQIEAILKPKKSSRPKRKKKDEEEVLDRFADEEVSRLREAMLTAADDDEQANKEKLPATSKLKMLSQVMEVLRKTSLAQSIIDNNLLEGVRRFLEPLPDRSLPALNIQKEIFGILSKLEYIDSAVLKESRLGRVVLFYTKSKRVTPDVARAAETLVSKWSRPIIKRSASYRDRVIPIAQEGDAVGQERLNAILARARESEKNRVRKNAVMIPQRSLGSYTVAPKADAGFRKNNAAVDAEIERRKRYADRMRSLSRKVTAK